MQLDQLAALLCGEMTRIVSEIANLPIEAGRMLRSTMICHDVPPSVGSGARVDP